MRRAERVVDIEVAAVGELVRESARRSSSRPGRSACSRARGPVRPAAALAAALRPAPSSTWRGPRPSSAGRDASRRAPRAAPRSSSSSSVGSEARMRVSSATRPSSSGTFRSARTSTRLARDVGVADRARVPHYYARRRPAASLPIFATGRRGGTVAPLVVVPADDLDQVRRSPSSDRRRRSRSASCRRCRTRRSDPRCTGGCPPSGRSRPPIGRPR